MWDDGKGICVGRAFCVTFCVLSFFVFLLTPTGHTRRPITTVYGSKRIKYALLGVSMIKNNVWGSKLPNMIFGGLNRHFKSKFVKFANRNISKSTHSINTKFEGEFQVHKWTSWVVLHYKIIIQDGGSRHLGFLYKHQ